MQLISTPLLGAEKITVLTEQYYPYTYTESGRDDGEIVGLATELVAAVLEEARLDYQISIMPWARVVRAAETTPNVLVYSMVRPPEREDQFHWTGLDWF